MNAAVAPAAGDTAVVRLAVQNVVAVARIAEALPLSEIAESIPGVEYPKRKYPGIVLRFAGPRVACHVYDSGKIVLTGLGTVDSLPGAFSAVVAALRGAGAVLVDPIPEPRIINVVASGNLGERISLLRLALALDLERVEYDPEHFAGLIFRASSGGVALVFASGAIVVMGVRSVDQAREVVAEVRGMIDTVGAWHTCP